MIETKPHTPSPHSDAKEPVIRHFEVMDVGGVSLLEFDLDRRDIGVGLVEFVLDLDIGGRGQAQGNWQA